MSDKIPERVEALEEMVWFNSFLEKVNLNRIRQEKKYMSCLI